MIRSFKANERRRFAPEVVQTSSMDCGPASLKCLLEGFHIPVSYGRLREACQTNVDGTSIDTIEMVANQLGVFAEQRLLPEDHLFLDEAKVLPAIVVVRHADTSTHFVVVWRKHGKWLQVMDPAVGRRWVSSKRFREEIFRHEMFLPAADWRAWAATEDFLAPLRARMDLLEMTSLQADALISEALSDAGWFPLGVLDASLRLIDSLVRAGGTQSGEEAQRVLEALFRQTCASTEDIFTLIPPDYWSVVPDLTSAEKGAVHLGVRGAIVLSVAARSEHGEADVPPPEPLSEELAAAISEKPDNPIQTVWGLLRQDGILAPLALIGAMAIAAGALALEALLFRGLFDIAAMLNVASQRLAAVLVMLVFMLILLAIQIPIVMETLRHGRHLDVRLRLALLRKLPLLNDRYFQSRPVSDMADRSHSIHHARMVPSIALQFVQVTFELLLTFICVMLIAPGSFFMAFLLVLVAMGIPLVVQPMLNERDLRVRNHAGAMHGFYLDALLGLLPIRAHQAERNVQRQHEGLLVEWARSSRGLIRMSLLADGVQSLLCLSLAGWLLVTHFSSAGGISGSDLLLVYWVVKLPAIAAHFSALAQQYPTQRNVLLRLLEPLSAPEEGGAEEAMHGVFSGVGSSTEKTSAAATGAAIRINQGLVLAGGHDILRDVDLAVAAGEHVAIVGVSGAGKSSLMGVLLGWHKLAAGQIEIDGLPLTGKNIESLRQVTAWVDPAIQLWNASLHENLEYASQEQRISQVGEVIEVASLRKVLEKLPEGLQTLIGESGALLSGGEGQRVRLGRALLQSNTRLVLLDEPFRGMDHTQRRALMTEARRWWADQTLLCVTHDVHETLSFNRVLVIEHGRIVEDGHPEQLAASASRYRELLDAETEVKESMWQGDQWRRIEMRQGRVWTGQAVTS